MVAKQRERNRVRTDPRAVRTRARLIEAFLDIAATGSVVEVSVSQITRTAGVDRSSFYAHFATVGELGMASVRDDLGVLLTDAKNRVLANPSEVTVRDCVRTFVDHVGSRRSIYADLLIAPVTGAVCADVVAMVRSVIASIVRRLDHTSNPETVGVFVANGALAVVGQWLNGGLSLTATELVDEIVDLLPPCPTRVG